MKQKTFNRSTLISRRKSISLIASAGLLSIPASGMFSKGKNAIDEQNVNQMNNNLSEQGFFSKTIGVLGGLGPQATIDLETRIHKASQQLAPQTQNSGYPSMVVHYYRHAPVLLADAHTPVFPWQADPRLLETARKLGQVADFILIPSNGVHLFQKEIEKASGKKVLSIIDETLREVQRRGWKKVGALGLMNAKVYTSRAEEYGISFVTITDELQQKLNQGIFHVMEGRETDVDRSVALEAIGQLRKQGVDGIIPGCTEIPFLLGEEMNASDMVNPLEVLAERAVREAR